MTALDKDEISWTEKACKMLSVTGYTCREEKLTRGTSFTFRAPGGGMHYNVANPSRQLALMHACFSTLNRTGNPFAKLCPRFFIS